MTRAIPILGFSCVAVIALYLCGVAAAIFFATLHTGLAHSIQETEGSVVSLESEYYDAMKRYSSADPSAAGFATPRAVEYVTGTGAAVLTRADR